MVSYKDVIKNWIEKCLEKTNAIPIIRETLVQYLYLIKKLTNQTTNNEMIIEIADLFKTKGDEIKKLVKLHNEINNDLIKKLKSIYSKIDSDKITNMLKNLNREYYFKLGGFDTGGDSTCFIYEVFMKGIVLVLEVDTSDYQIASYSYIKDDKSQNLKQKLKEKDNVYKYNEKPEKIVSEITKQLEDLIKIIEDEAI